MTEEQGKREAADTKRQLGPEAGILAAHLGVLVALEAILMRLGLFPVAAFLIVYMVVCIAMGIFLYGHRSANE